MRKILSLVLALCLALGCVSLAAAEQAQDSAAVHGVDAVVVLDMTHSMVDRNNSKGNDNYGYRLDATAMLIGMLDMNGSRVAIVPFADQAFSVTELTKVDSKEERTRLIDQIRRLQTRPNTNIGAALMRANQILSSRSDQNNQPMIVLLTDGENQMAENGSKVTESYRWDAATGTIKDPVEEVYTTRTANEVTREAVACASALGYPIYTVALNTNPASEPNGGMSLNQISIETGVTIGAQRANADTVDKLPEFFANILADKIGSSVQVTMRPRSVGEKLYEVTIPILNRSIQETNIIIPVQNAQNQATKRRSNSSILADSIRVFNGGQEPGEPKVTIMYRNGFFAMVKIRNPEEAGDWKLRFESEEDPSTISFNLLYNYDITLRAGVSKLDGSSEFYKKDTVKVVAQFLDGSGAASTDRDLYTDHTDQVGEEYSAWAKIIAQCSLYRTGSDGNISGDPLYGPVELTAPDTRDRFETNLDLSQVTPALGFGDYMLRIIANGAGLTRQVDIPLRLKNHAPHSSRTYEETIHVNPLEDQNGGRWTVNGTSGALEKMANEIITDEDNDKLYYDLQPAGPDQAATMRMDGESIRFTTKENDGRVLGGDAVYTLSFTDQESPNDTVTLTLHIISDVDELLKAYSLEMKTSDPSDGTEKKTFRKNSPILVTIQLKNQQQEYAGEDLLEKLKATLTVTKDGDPWEPKEMILKGDRLEYTLTSTGNSAAEWTFEAKVSYFEPVKTAATVENAGGPAPVKAKDLQIFTDGEGVPGFLASVLGRETPQGDPALRVASADLFTDDDQDELVYAEPVIVAPGTEKVLSALKAEPVAGEDGVYQIRVKERATSLFNWSYGAELKITATDGDEETGTYVRKITVVDLFNRMITDLILILIAIVILVILFLIIHQIRKPKFPKLNLTIREEPSLYETSSETLSPVKTPTNVNRIGVDGDMAAKHNISMELLQNTVIKPLRSISSVGVRYIKNIPGHEVMMDDVRMKAKKWYVWKIGQELSIRNVNGEGLIAIKLEDRSSDQEGDDLTEFGNGDDWTSGGFEEQAPETGKKRSHKVNRPTGGDTAPETPQSSGNDDFDF